MKIKIGRWASAGLSAVLLLTSTGTSAAQTFDLVLANGRVIDPESGMDGVFSVGIRGGKVEVVSARPIQGRTVLDVRGMVVAPGFIDLHSHGQDDENYRFKAHDGVTTALELEIGVSPVASWYAARQGKALVNFGASSGHVPAKMAVMRDTGTFLPRDEAVRRIATDEEQLSILNAVRQGLDDGAIGIGFGIAYVPMTSHEEILRLFQLAAERRLPVFVHMRGGAPEPDGSVPSLQELLADAAVTGVSLHVVHITSVGGKHTATLLQMIEGARKHGIDVTTKCTRTPRRRRVSSPRCTMAIGSGKPASVITICSGSPPVSASRLRHSPGIGGKAARSSRIPFARKPFASG
jgi:N-acyl-D-aspartate/D-glutamate deacylase